MTDRQTVFVIVFALCCVALIVWLIAKSKLREKYSIIWFAFAAVVLSLPFLYDFYIRVGSFIGFIDSSTYLLFGIVVFLVLMVLQVCVSLTTAHIERKRLVQKFAMLELKFRELESKSKKLTEKES